MEPVALAAGVAVIGWAQGHRCAVWAVCGVLTGCAAYAQDAPIPASMGAGSELWMLELVKAGGLPAVLGITGWMFGRGGLPVTIQLGDRPLVVRLHEDDARRLDRLVEAMEHEDERRKRRSP